MPFSKKEEKRNQLFAILIFARKILIFLFKRMQKVSLKWIRFSKMEFNLIKNYFLFLKPLYFKMPSVCCPNKGK